MFRKFAKIYVVFCIVSALAVVSFNYYIDPLQFYGLSEKKLRIKKNLRYQNPGLARNAVYDSVIIGSSHSLLFDTAYAGEQLGGRWINLAVDGSTAREQKLILGVAVGSRPVKSVIWEVRLDAYIGEPDRVRSAGGAFPYFLYQDSLATPLQYLFSLDTTLLSYSVLRPVKNRPHTPKGKKAKTFSREQALAAWSYYCAVAPKNGHRVELRGATYNLEKNIRANIVRTMVENPDVEFSIFFPPYSILSHLIAHRHKNVEFVEQNDFKEIVTKLVSDLPNAAVFDFQAREEVIFQLGNYRDLNHYRPDIHKLIVDEISGGGNQSSLEDVSRNGKELEQMVLSYDTSKLPDCAGW